MAFLALFSKSQVVGKLCTNCRKASFLSRFSRRKGEKMAATDMEAGAAGQSEAVVLSEFEYDESPPPALSKHYTPSAKVADKILSVAQQLSTDTAKVTPTLELADNIFKYQVLSACIEEFQFDIPSCELGELKTLADVITYYSQARNPISAEERLKSANLPGNVHLEFEPMRFTEDTKHLFGGKTAFPQRDTKVTSLKYRHIYKGYETEKVYQKKDGFHYY